MSRNAAPNPAIELLRLDHERIAGLFEEYFQSSQEERDFIAADLCDALSRHAQAEEQFFYPRLLEAGMEAGCEQSLAEHGCAKALAEKLGAALPGTRRDGICAALRSLSLSHIAFEENELFAHARRSCPGLADCADSIADLLCGDEADGPGGTPEDAQK